MFKRKKEGWLLAAVSDLHSNSTIGLCPPRFKLDDGGTYEASKPQQWLWQCWLSYWQEIKDLAASLSLNVAVVVNGDSTDGDHHDTPQIITRNLDDQLDIALEVLKPALDVADKHFIIRGTEAHSGKSGWMEERLAKETGAVANDDTHSWWHLLLDLDGVVFDIKHHPESGSMRPWTSGAESNRIAAILVYEYARSGVMPHVALRAHRHGFRNSGKTHPIEVFTTPPWQLTTAFGHRIGVGGNKNAIGGLYFICKKEKYRWEQISFTHFLPAPLKLEL
jgi:hypothetical protein